MLKLVWFFSHSFGEVRLKLVIILEVDVCFELFEWYIIILLYTTTLILSYLQIWKHGQDEVTSDNLRRELYIQNHCTSTVHNIYIYIYVYMPPRVKDHNAFRGLGLIYRL